MQLPGLARDQRRPLQRIRRDDETWHASAKARQFVELSRTADSITRWSSRAPFARGHDLFDEVWEGVLQMNPAPSGRHAQIEAQLLAILRAPARAARLTVTGQFKHVKRSRLIDLGAGELAGAIDRS